MIEGKKIGLALSGGGYRAAAFHLGVMGKLDELGILENVDVLSTISGGSITGAYYCLEKKPYKQFEAEMKERLCKKGVIRRVLLSRVFLRTAILFIVFLVLAGYLLYTPYPWTSYLAIALLLIILMKYQFRIFPASKAVERAYERIFYNFKTLKDLDLSRPKLAIGSSNIQTGRPFTFSRDRMEDTSYSFVNGKRVKVYVSDNFPIARAVTASSCVPFAFSPVTIGKEFLEKGIKGEFDPRLIDGGVYDNQGVHKLTHPESDYRCDLVIASDAGNKMFQQKYRNTIGLLVRTVDIFMVRIKNFQMVKNMYTTGAQRGFDIAYLGLSWKLDKSIGGFIDAMTGNNVPLGTLSAHGLLPEWIKEPALFRREIETRLKENVKYKEIEDRDLSPADMKIAGSVSTNLTCLSADQIRCLMTHAANITELQVRLYLPPLIKKG